jgi:3-isopropylmalate dehydratase small subunit
VIEDAQIEGRVWTFGDNVDTDAIVPVNTLSMTFLK